MTASGAKSEILDAIRQNLAVSEPFDLVHESHRVHRQKIADLLEESSFVKNVPLVLFDSNETDLIDEFCENLVTVGGNVLKVSDLSEAVAQIEFIIQSKNVKKIAVSDGHLIGEINNSLQTNAAILVNANAADLFDCDLGITGAQFGISETGTLVLESEKEFNRLASLVPPVHICVLETKNVRRTLGETLAILEKDLSRAITFITGPSRTSDIELTLQIGVHGPGEIHVVLIENHDG